MSGHRRGRRTGAAAGRLLRGTARTDANTLQVRDAAGAFRNRVAGVGVDATGWNWSAQFGGLGYDGDLDLYTVNGMVGEAFGYLPGRELLSTGWPVPRRASPLPMLWRSGSRSWKVASSAFARSGRPPAMSGSKPRGPRSPRHTL